MADTKTCANRIVAGGEVHLRKAPWGDRWEISSYGRVLNATTALMEGVLRWEQLKDHPILHQTYATPDDAAEAVRHLLAA